MDSRVHSILVVVNSRVRPA